MHASTAATRAPASTPTARAQAPAGGARDPKQGLRGLDFGDQEKQLRPPAGGAAPASAPAAGAAARAAPPTYDVSHTYNDGPYQGVARYGAQFVGNECQVTVRCLLQPDAGVTPGELEDVQAKAQAEVTRVWDDKFTITDRRSHQAYKLRVGVVFTADRPHITVALRLAGDARVRENEGNWFVDTAFQDDTTLAHEIGHALGLGDEYVDAEVPNRATSTSPGVTHDDSIMADADSETAHAHLRHGTSMANDIGAASHRSFSAALTPPAAAPSAHARR
ncbi:MAG: hypothetical protein U1F43_06155 [Myxococcota bacterium]